MKKLRITDEERRLGLKYHSGVAAVQQERRVCRICKCPLTTRTSIPNTKGAHEGCLKAQAFSGADPEERKTRKRSTSSLRAHSSDREIAPTIEQTKVSLDGKELLKCTHCETGVMFHLTSPACWPINVVAITCSTCGHVRGYYDDILSSLIMEPNSKHEMPSRQFAATRRGSHPLHTEDKLRELVIEGLTIGVEMQQIAEDLEVTEEFIHAVGINAGLRHLVEYRQDSVAALVKQGRTDRQIAEELGITYTNAKSMRCKMGLKANPAKTRGDEMRERWLQGERPVDIARSMGIAPSIVATNTRRLRIQGIRPKLRVEGNNLVN